MEAAKWRVDAQSAGAGHAEHRCSGSAHRGRAHAQAHRPGASSRDAQGWGAGTRVHRLGSSRLGALGLEFKGLGTCWGAAPGRNGGADPRALAAGTSGCYGRLPRAAGV